MAKFLVEVEEFEKKRAPHELTEQCKCDFCSPIPECFWYSVSVNTKRLKRLLLGAIPQRGLRAKLKGLKITRIE